MTKDEKSIAIIACDHGYGHVRRCLIIASKLADLNWQVNLFAPAGAVRKLASSIDIDTQILLSDFSIGTRIDQLCRGTVDNWIKRLSSMDEFALVLSDNLLDILKIRPDATLSGSFLWHRALDCFDTGLYAEAESLLEHYSPKMIGSSLFAADELREITEFYPVGLFVSQPPDYHCLQGSDLLITCGMSGEIESEYSAFIKQLALDEKPPFNTVWVEPRLMPVAAPGWMKAATFDADMYKNLSAAICRPGVGTLTDCLWGGARVFCCFEAGNREMVDNTRAVNKAGVGESFSTLIDAYYSAVGYWQTRSAKTKHLESLKKINFDGATETSVILEKIIAYRTNSF